MASSTLNIANSALSGLQTALNSVYNNIANANTKGYKRIDPQFIEAPTSVNSRGIFSGNGVFVNTAREASNSFLDQNILSSLQQKSAAETAYSKAQELDSVLSDYKISNANAEFFNALQDANNKPSGVAERTVLLAKANQVADTWNNLQNRIDALKTDIGQEIPQVTNLVNSLATSIAQTPNADRSSLVQELNQYIGASLSPDGSQVVLSSGQVLVDQAVASPITGITVDSTNIKGGQIGGLIKAYQENILPIENSLSAVRENWVNGINTQHVQGQDLNGDPGQNLFSLSGNKISVNLNNYKQLALAAQGSDPEALGDNSNGLELSKLSSLGLSDYTAAVANSGIRTKQAGQWAGLSKSTYNQAQASYDEFYGVNVDEELLQLLKYQQHYQAAAKLVEIDRAMFATLMGIFN